MSDTSKPNMPSYDTIGIGYNSTRNADPYLAGVLYTLLETNENGSYLDIGCGTGNYTIALHKKGLMFTGIDPSLRMLEKARKRCNTINWIQGKSEELPLDDNSYDGVMATLTLHHWKDLKKGFSELSRVVKNTGKFALLTTLPEQTRAYWLNDYFPQMMEDSIAVLPTMENIEESLSSSGWKITEKIKYFVKDDLQDLFLYAGKNKPELYLDKKFRQGVSSFSALSNAKEVKEGLSSIERDLSSGEIYDIIKKHKNELGDYLFIQAELSK